MPLAGRQMLPLAYRQNLPTGAAASQAQPSRRKQVIETFCFAHLLFFFPRGGLVRL